MNTTSLVLNGRTAIEIEYMIPKTAMSLTTITTPKRPSFMSRTSSTSSTSSTRSRPPSRDSPGWYLNADTTPTLEDFAARTQTIAGRINHWQGISGKNAVMALMRGTPMTLVVFHPIVLVFWLLVLAVLRPVSVSQLLLHPIPIGLWILFIATWFHLKSLNWMIK